MTTEETALCECGLVDYYTLGYTPEHRSSPEHVRAILAGWDDKAWQEFIYALDHGLSWADSESMGIVDREETMAQVRYIVASFRR